MTDYLQLARERAPQQPTDDAENPYLDLARQQQQLQQNQARTVLEMAYKDNPDVAAERQRLSQTSGVPLRVVERNLEELRIKEQARAVDLVSMAKDSPVLYRQLMDPTFTTTSVDDLGTLGKLEKTVGNTVRYVMGADGKGGLPSDVAGGAKTLALGGTVGVGKMMFDMAAVVNDLIGWDAGAAGARYSAKRAQESMDEFGMQAESDTGRAVKSGLQSAGQNLALLPLGLERSLFQTANAAATAVAGLMSAGVGADAFNQAREKGKGVIQAGMYAIPEAAFEFVFEKIPAGKLFGDIAANTGLLKTLGKQAVSEGWTEQVTTLAQDFNEWMNLNPEKTLAEFIAERPDAAYQTFIATLVGVGVQTSTIHGINKIVEKTSNQMLKFELDQFNEQMTLASQSLLRQRSPEQFRAHVQQVIDNNDGAKQEIFVDGGVLAQLPQDLLAQLPESVQSQIADAAATNSAVSIPMADVLTIAPGTPLEQVLNDNARMTPESMSRIEAQQAGEKAQEFIKQEGERVLRQAADQQAWATSSENVKNTIWTQLNEAGRFTSDVNEAYATLQMHFFSTMAARWGVTPEELYQEWSLKAGAQAGQGAVLNAGGPTVNLGGREVPITLSALDAHRGMALVPVNVAGFDEGFKRQTDGNFYVGPQGEGGIAGRYERFSEFQATADSIEAPTVSVDAKGNVMFGNGRHRYAFMRDQGVGQIPVAMDEESLANAVAAGYVDAGVFNQAAVAHETDQDQTNSLGAARISPRLPTAVKATEDALADTRLQPDLATAMRDPAAFAHNIGLMATYPNFQGLTGTVEEQAEAIIQHAMSNLLWLHDHWKPEYRNRSKMWYVGGNRIAHRWAAQFGVTPEQVAAVIAATSPQKDWFQNVSLAERILDAVINNSEVAWDAKMTKLVNTRDWGPKAVPDVSRFEGKTLRDLYAAGTPDALLDMAIWIRAWDEANNPMKARVITPEGGFTDKFDAGKSGKEIGLRWQSFPTIVKTLQVLMNNDRAALSQIIGANHKVRSFFNNIIAPYAGDDVTIDTHAVAAALLRPLGSSSTEVFHNFGSGEPGSPGPKNSAITGLYGTYAIYAEAYRRAAAERGILPREMQSITWEAVRGLFRPEQKNDRIRTEADRIWASAATGETSAEDARKQIEQLVGGIVDPAWTGSVAGENEAPADSSYASELSEARRPAGATDGRGGADAAAGTQQGGTASEVLNQFPAGREVSSLGLYSALAEQVSNLPTKASSSQGWRDALKGLVNKGAVKQDEIEWTGLNEWLALQQGKVTKEAVVQYLQANGVQVEEVTLGGAASRYGKYTTPGGENYREVLLTLHDENLKTGRHALGEPTPLTVDEAADRIGVYPDELTSDPEARILVYPGNLYITENGDGTYYVMVGRDELSTASLAEAEQFLAEAMAGENDSIDTGAKYRSNHWAQPNVLAHLRVNDRTDADGKRVLFVEEIQSDWGQEGKKRGFNRALAMPGISADELLMGYGNQMTDAQKKWVNDFIREWESNPGEEDALTAKYDEWLSQQTVQGIPAAPFVTKTEGWLNLALKRVITMAAEGGYDRVAFVNGEQSADRYDLSKQVDSIHITKLKKGGFEFTARQGGREIISREVVPDANALAGAVGKDLAEKADAQELDSGKTYSGIDLKVGGEGMKTFYDKIVPNAVNAMLKKLGGGKVGAVAFSSNAVKLDRASVIDAAISYMNGDLAAEEFLAESGLGDAGMTEDDVTRSPIEGRYEPGERQEQIAEMFAKEVVRRYSGQAGAQLGFDVTPEMKAQASTGLPLFQNSQSPRGTFNPQTLLISLNENADLSTFLHESGHFFLEVMAGMASQPGAPQQIVDDMATALKWFGVPDMATWNSYTLDQKRPYHERWAESFEQYLLEGKAPNAELQPLFRRFRSWLVNVYKSLTHFMRERDLKVSDEIRQVFDRMIATDEQIAQAEETAGLLPDFDATNEAIEKLQARSLRDLKWAVNARNKAIKALQKQAAELRKGVRAEVTAEVNAMPEFAAKEMLDKTRKENKQQLNDTELAIIADTFQYASAEDMLRAIDAAGKKADVIEGMTDQRMLERHGDLVDQRAIEEAANEAVHNEARAKSLATELKSQAEMLNPRQDTGRTNTAGSKITVNAITEAAKQFAQNLVARRRVKDLRNAAHQHRAAEARAGKAWQEATTAGKTQEAVQAKRDQVLNNFTVKALQEAQLEAKKILEFFKRVTKDSNEKTVDKGRDPDVVNAMRAILAAYDVAPRLEKSANDYLAVVEKNDPAMHGALKPTVDAAIFNAKPIAEMTMEELRGLHDEMQAMWHLAKRSRQMEIDGNLMDLQDAEDELQARMQDIGVPLTMPGESGALTAREELARKLQFAGSILRRVEQWAEGMGAPFTKLVFQPVKSAANAYRTDRVKYRKAYQALVDNVAPSLNKGLIEAPELGYTFGKGHNGIGHAELLHAILHTGNESNKRKLLLGRKWATENADGTLDTGKWDAFIKRMHDTGVLGKAHYDFAQGVWDLLEQTKPLAQKTHRDVFGRYFAEVTADSFDTPFGSYRGGYVPAQADPRIVQDADLRKLAEAENESMMFSFPGTNKGFTKGRVEYNRPLMLDLRTIGQHIDKVLLFAHMEPAVRDVNKLLSRKGVSYSLGRIDPTIYAGMLTPWLSRSARQVVETPIVGDGGVSRMLSAARNRAGMALMFANVSNSIQQLTGFSTAFAKIKADGLSSHMTRATAQFIAHPKQMAKTVSDASEFMANRMDNEISAINDAMDAILLDPNLYEKAQAWSQKHAYFLQTAFANTMEPIIWTAAYNGALEKNGDEKAAVRYADSVIRQTQGSTLPEDVSRIETGPAYARMFTQFIGYFNMMANTNATALKQISHEVGLKQGAGKALAVVTMGLLVPLWIAEAIAQAMRGGPDDEDKDGYLDDWLAAVFGMGTIKGTLAMVPFVGQVANAAVNRLNNNPADDKISLSPAVSLLEASAGNLAHVYKAITGDADKINKRNMVRDVASAVSIATGLPAVAIARPLGYLAGVAQDKIDPTGPVDMVRGAVTGTPSPASK